MQLSPKASWQQTKGLASRLAVGQCHRARGVLVGLISACILMDLSHHATARTDLDTIVVETTQGPMKAYQEQIPGTDISFTMIPIPGGTLRLGSPAEEVGRKDDEGPQRTVRITPMWVGRCEVTWGEYHVYMKLYEPFKQLNELKYLTSQESTSQTPLKNSLKKNQALSRYLETPADVDAVTCPTPLYDPSFTYEIGEDPRQPAVTMTQFAAKQYTKWLSGITGHQYRLPTEAEWEYAARAGSTTAYCYGNQPAELSRYAWFNENSEEKTHPVGSKKPNPWHLHDVHGNVAEWVLDEYAADHYHSLPKEPIESAKAARWPTVLFPRVVRGGCWFDDPSMCRSAARHQSADEDWNLSDPNIPKSPWWFTEYESTGVGFRIVRPLLQMDAETRTRVWDADIEETRLDVEDRLAEGRGTQVSATKLLPTALGELEASSKDPDVVVPEP